MTADFRSRLRTWNEEGAGPAITPKRIEQAAEGPFKADDRCIALPVPGELLDDHQEGGPKLAAMLHVLLGRGAGNGRFGGRLVLLFPTRGAAALPPWGRRDVERVCREALDAWPGLLDTLLWEEHPDLVELVPDEDDRMKLYGRLAFVALAESEAVWDGEKRDLEANRSELEKWQTKARRLLA